MFLDCFLKQPKKLEHAGGCIMLTLGQASSFKSAGTLEDLQPAVSVIIQKVPSTSHSGEKEVSLTRAYRTWHNRLHSVSDSWPRCSSPSSRPVFGLSKDRAHNRETASLQIHEEAVRNLHSLVLRPFPIPFLRLSSVVPSDESETCSCPSPSERSSDAAR